MRIALKIAAIGLAAGLGACASVKDAAPPVPDHASEYANYISARFAAVQFDLKGASHYYSDSLKADPANKDLLRSAFFFASASGDIDEAARLAQLVVAQTPNDSDARLTLAVVALRKHDFAGARAQINQSDTGPFAAMMTALVDGWAAAGIGDKPGAIADMTKLRAQGGAEQLAMLHLALVSDYLGDAEIAEMAYRATLTSGGTPRVIDAYGRFLERAGRTRDATDFYTKFSADGALRAITGAGLARLKAGAKPDRMVPRAEDGVAEALFTVAAAQTDQASALAAIHYLRLALYLRPGLDLGAVLLADRLENLQKYDDAIAVYATVDKASPYWRMAQVEMALDEARVKRSDAAIAHLKALTADQPDDAEAWIALGDTYRSTDKFAEATAAYDRAVALRDASKSADWQLYFARAVSEQGTKNWDAAEADLQKALALSPAEPTLLNYLGYTWVDQNRNIAQALAMLEKAHTLKPTDGYIADSVGWAYYKLGRYADAAKALQVAVELVPGDPTINDHLGDAYWRTGRKLEAQFQWNHALAFGPADADKAVIEKKLKDGLDDGAKSN